MRASEWLVVGVLIEAQPPNKAGGSMTLDMGEFSGGSPPIFLLMITA